MAQLLAGVTGGAGVAVLASYAELARRGGATAAAFGRFTALQTHRGVAAAWTVGVFAVAAAELGLWSTTVANYGGGDAAMRRYAWVALLALPLAAGFWADRVSSATPPAGNVEVVAAAAASLLFVPLVGQFSGSAVPLQWAAATAVVGWHVVVDGILWPVRPAGRPVVSIDAVAAVVHLGSAVALWATAADGAGYALSTYRFPLRSTLRLTHTVWRFDCPDGVSTDCADDDKDFYIAENNQAYPLLPLACGFAVWSGLHHLVAVPHPTGGEWWWKWADYAVSAPLMLSVIAVTFGSTSLLPTVVAPLVLAAAVAAGAAVDDHTLREADPPWAWEPWQRVTMVAAVAAYAGAWAPVYSTTAMIYTRTAAAGEGTLPGFVWIFLGVTTAVFSSFIGVFLWPWSSRAMRAHAFKFLSMVAKTTLHLFIGLSSINIGQTLQRDGVDDMGRAQQGLIGAAAIVVVLGVVAYRTRPGSP